MIDRTKLAARLDASRELGAVRVELHHRAVLRTVRAEGRPVWVRRVTERSDMAELADSIAEAAEADALGEGAAYEVRALDGEGVPVATHPFTVGTPRRAAASAEQPPEQPTEQGLVAQLMRHLEATTKLQTLGAARLCDLYEHQIERLTKRCNALEERELKVRELAGQLAEQNTDAELRQLQALKREERRDTVIAQVAPLIPVVLSSVVAKVAPGSTAASTAELQALDSFLLSLTHEQLPELQKSLKPEQQIAVFQAWERARERKANHQSQAAALPAKAPS